jgi:acyl-CoA synthetase (AMP-forming)/AMP-acid ligase II
MTDSLAFRALDHHVIHGAADTVAFAGVGRPMTYAHLLHDSACVAGALREIGVGVGTQVALDVAADRERTIAVLACARLGAEPAEEAPFVIAGDPLVLTTPDTEVPWDVLLHAGRIDPAPAPDADPDGYEERLRAAHPVTFDILLTGGMLT